MDATLADADAVIHLAGINRASDDETIATVNPWLAEQLVASMRRMGKPMPVVYGNSIHSLGDSVFGVAKRRAAGILRAWGDESGAPVADVLLPNIFGEHGQPFYNSVVSTFCHLLSRVGRRRSKSTAGCRCCTCSGLPQCCSTWRRGPPAIAPVAPC